MRTAVFLASVLVGLVGTTAARAQVFDLDADRVPVVELKGLWRFHTGDDPDGKLGWASPKFDDAKWKLIRSDLPWDEQGYKGYTGFAWYRVQVKLPQKRIPLAIAIPHISTSYQVFADGRLIGQFGGMPPHPKIETEPPQIFFSAG
jgi:phosphoserine phosphatase RsbU/P